MLKCLGQALFCLLSPLCPLGFAVVQGVPPLRIHVVAPCQKAHLTILDVQVPVTDGIGGTKSQQVPRIFCESQGRGCSLWSSAVQHLSNHVNCLHSTATDHRCRAILRCGHCRAWLGGSSCSRCLWPGRNSLHIFQRQRETTLLA